MPGGPIPAGSGDYRNASAGLAADLSPSCDVKEESTTSRQRLPCRRSRRDHGQGPARCSPPARQQRALRSSPLALASVPRGLRRREKRIRSGLPRRSARRGCPDLRAARCARCGRVPHRWGVEAAHGEAVRKVPFRRRGLLRVSAAGVSPRAPAKEEALRTGRATRGSCEFRVAIRALPPRGRCARCVRRHSTPADAGIACASAARRCGNADPDARRTPAARTR